jgi:hypothetical protein
MSSKSKWRLSSFRKKSNEAKNASQAAGLSSAQGSQQHTDSSSRSPSRDQPSPSEQTNVSESSVQTASRPTQQTVPISSQLNLRNEIFPTGETYGLQILYKPPTPIVDIIFIHGLTGSSYSTWLQKDSNIYWPVHLLSKDIPDARIMAFGYDADVAKLLGPVSQNRLADHARGLLEGLAVQRDDEDAVRALYQRGLD